MTKTVLETPLKQSTDMVAVLFGEDQLTLGQLLVTIPHQMEQDVLVQQILLLASVEGILKKEDHHMVYVALRPVDPIEDADLYKDTTRTVH